MAGLFRKIITLFFLELKAKLARRVIRRFKPKGNLSSLERLVNYHYTHTPSYRKFVKDSSLQSLQSIPVLSKEDFLTDDIESWTSKHFKSKRSTYSGLTSGSSGIPFHYRRDWSNHLNIWQGILERYSSVDIDVFRDRQARFYGTDGSTIERVKDFLLNRKRFRVLTLDKEKFEQYYDIFTSEKFAYVYGYPNAIALFSKWIIDTDRPTLNSVCKTLKCCLVTGEMLFESDRKLIEAAFGVEVYNEYGLSEIDVVAFGNELGEWLINTKNLLVEVVDEEGQQVPEGELGYLLVTALSNYAMPFIRYKTGDKGSLIKERSSDKMYLTKLQGRNNDVITLSDGRIVHGMFFYYELKTLVSALKSRSEESIGRMYVELKGSIITIYYERSAPLTTRFIEEISDRVKRVLDDSFSVVLVQKTLNTD